MAECGWGEDVGVRTSSIGCSVPQPRRRRRTTAGWAQELVQTQYADLLSQLIIESVYDPLTARQAFGTRSGATGKSRSRLKAPRQPSPARSSPRARRSRCARKRSASIVIGPEEDGGDHVVHPRAVRALVSRTSTRNSATRWADDTSVAIDTILLDNNPPFINPARWHSGWGDRANADDRRRFCRPGRRPESLCSVSSSRRIGLRTPVWIMNPQQALSIALTQSRAGVGVFPFKAEIEAGRC